MYFGQFVRTKLSQAPSVAGEMDPPRGKPEAGARSASPSGFVGPVVTAAEHRFWVGNSVDSRDTSRGGVVDRASKDVKEA